MFARFDPARDGLVDADVRAVGLRDLGIENVRLRLRHRQADRLRVAQIEARASLVPGAAVPLIDVDGKRPAGHAHGGVDLRRRGGEIDDQIVRDSIEIAELRERNPAGIVLADPDAVRGRDVDVVRRRGIDADAVDRLAVEHARRFRPRTGRAGAGRPPQAVAGFPDGQVPVAGAGQDVRRISGIQGHGAEAHGLHLVGDALPAPSRGRRAPQPSHRAGVDVLVVRRVDGDGDHTPIQVRRARARPGTAVGARDARRLAPDPAEALPREIELRAGRQMPVPPGPPHLLQRLVVAQALLHALGAGLPVQLEHVLEILVAEHGAAQDQKTDHCQGPGRPGCITHHLPPSMAQRCASASCET